MKVGTQKAIAFLTSATVCFVVALQGSVPPIVSFAYVMIGFLMTPDWEEPSKDPVRFSAQIAVPMVAAAIWPLMLIAAAIAVGVQKRK